MPAKRRGVYYPVPTARLRLYLKGIRQCRRSRIDADHAVHLVKKQQDRFGASEPFVQIRVQKNNVLVIQRHVHPLFKRYGRPRRKYFPMAYHLFFKNLRFVSYTQHRLTCKKFFFRFVTSTVAFLSALCEGLRALSVKIFVEVSNAEVAKKDAEFAEKRLKDVQTQSSRYRFFLLSTKSDAVGNINAVSELFE